MHKYIYSANMQFNVLDVLDFCVNVSAFLLLLMLLYGE